jgi:hypothetical protein
MAASRTQKFESTRDFRFHYCFSFSSDALNRGLTFLSHLFFVGSRY